MVAHSKDSSGTPTRAAGIPHGRIVVGVALALVLTSVAYWLGDRADVPAVVLSSAPFVAEVPGRGRLDAASLVTVGTEAPGRLEAILVDVGDTVRRGDPLVRLDADVAREQLRSATAAAASTDEAVRSARAELASAVLRAAERRDDHERIAPLAGTVIPAADVSSARVAFAQAEAEVDRATARLAQAQAQAAAAAADRAAAERRLDDLVVRAPIAGVVVMRSADPGDVVAAGAPLVRVTDPSTLEVVAHLDESVMPGLRVGAPVRVEFAGAGGRSAGGRLRSIGREVDAETREVEVRVALESAPDRWAIGQRVDVRVGTEPATSAVAAPTALIAWDASEPGVFVLDGGRARWVAVELGTPSGDRIGIMRGVRVGDTLLTPAGLRTGKRVTPTLAAERTPR
jgi:HlyD family secretion protein